MDRKCFHVGVFGSPAMTSAISGTMKGGTTPRIHGRKRFCRGEDGLRPAGEEPAMAVPAEPIVYCQAQRASIHGLRLAPAGRRAGIVRDGHTVAPEAHDVVGGAVLIQLWRRRWLENSASASAPTRTCPGTRRWNAGSSSRRWGWRAPGSAIT